MESTPKRSNRTPLIVIAGETASGKSALALALAERYNGEIVSADSWQVYRGFDIGTAKPSEAERARIPHHLIDVANPEDGFNAPLFQHLARQAIADIGARGRLPILVGGTGLYIDSVIFDFAFLPAPPAGVRAELSSLTLSELHARVHAAGLSMAGIDERNKRRVIRLLETDGRVARKGSLRPDTLLLGVHVERGYLHERITARVDAMLAAGLEDEVRGLVARYDWSIEPMKGIGYREWQSYFQGAQSLATTRDRIVSATMSLAKRQRTWFQRNSVIQWLTSEDKIAESVDITTSFLNT